jgi:arylsulfatase A-like enzyme
MTPPPPPTDRIRRPNIVFVLIDDLGWRDLSCYGSPFYETPHLDRIAAEGLRFTDAYAACPVCSPSRASLLTGKYPARLGVTNYIHDGEGARGKLLDAPFVRELRHTETSLAAALREGGYATWHVGKWHLGGEEFRPETHGFAVNVGGCHLGHPSHGYFSPYRIPTLPDGPEGEYLTDRLTGEAIRLIERHAAESPERPFFLNLWHYTVHTPIQAPEPLIAKYREKAAALGLDTVEPFEEGDWFPCEHKKSKRILRRRVQSDPVYAAMVENLDTNLGRLRAALERTGAWDDTLFVFTSDNGGLATAEGSPTCNAPLNEGKGWMYEGGTREPLIACWPGVTPPGALCDVPVTSPDLYPTLLEAAGLPPRPEQHVDGVSLAGLLRGERPDSLEMRPIFWHYPHYGNQGGTPGASVRLGVWKLIEFFEDSRRELYYLEDDPGETRDLAAESPERVETLATLLHDWLRDVGARLPASNPAFVPWRDAER